MSDRRERRRLGRGWGTGAVPRRILLALLAGRLAYRGTTALLPVALLAVWGPDRFGPYASLFGTWLFLNPMLSWGLEKAALLLLPRTRAGRPYVLGALITFGVALALPAAVGFVLLALVSDSPVATLSAVLALLNVAQGMNQALVGYQRALGRPLVDTANYLTAGALNVAAVALAAWAGLTPLGFGLVLLAGTAALDLAHTVALATHARLGARLLARRRLVRHAAGTAFFMGFNIILVTVTTSALFVVLAWHGLERESAYLYVAISIFNVAHAALDYLLRVYQPSVALLLRRGRAAEIRRGVARWSWRLLASAAACVVADRLPAGLRPAHRLPGAVPAGAPGAGDPRLRPREPRLLQPGREHRGPGRRAAGHRHRRARSGPGPRRRVRRRLRLRGREGGPERGHRRPPRGRARYSEGSRRPWNPLTPATRPSR